MSRVGIDIVEVADVEEAVAHFGIRYTERVYTAREIDDCGGDARRLAARWAAKEAAVKALRLGPEVPTPPREIEVVRTARGPELVLHGGLAARARAQGWLRAEVSLTHTDGCAAAVVLVETGDPARGG